MHEDQAYLEPIRAAALAVLADPPPLTEWEAGDGDDGEVIDPAVEKLLAELGWPTRTHTFAMPITVFGSDPHREEEQELTETYLPSSWLTALDGHVKKYVEARDAGQALGVPGRLRLRHLPATADFDALRALADGAWDHAGDELACTIAIMHPCDEMTGIRLNFATILWYGLYAYDSEDTPPRGDEGLSYEERLTRAEKDSFWSLRNLPSPKWRAWFADRVAVHDALVQCGVEATTHLGTDLHRAGYTFEADVSHMTVEELVTRLEARHETQSVPQTSWPCERGT